MEVKMCRHHTCSFLSAAVCVKVIATLGVKQPPQHSRDIFRM